MLNAQDVARRRLSKTKPGADRGRRKCSAVLREHFAEEEGMRSRLVTTPPNEGASCLQEEVGGYGRQKEASH
jgi:hypothetical protein